MDKTIINPYEANVIEWDDIPNELLSGDGWFQIETEYSIAFGIPNRKDVNFVTGFDIIFSPLLKIYREQKQLFSGEIEYSYSIKSLDKNQLDFNFFCTVAEATHASFIIRYNEFFTNTKALNYIPKYPKKNIEELIKETLSEEGWPV